MSINKTPHEVTLENSLMLRDKFKMPATQARSTAGQFDNARADMACFQPDASKDETLKSIANALIGKEMPKIFDGFLTVMNEFLKRPVL